MISLFPGLVLPESGADGAAQTGPAATAAESTGSADFLADWTAGSSAEPMIGQVAMALFVVIALIVVLAWLARRFLPLTGKSGGGRRLKVLDTLHLGRRRRVQVLRVGARNLVVGVSPDRIDLLTELSDTELEATPAHDENEPPRPARARFADLIPFRPRTGKAAAGGEADG